MKYPKFPPEPYYERELQGMSIADLSRRYADSFIIYGNHVRYCLGFAFTVNEIVLHTKEGLSPFHYASLNTAQPSPRWVIVGEIPVYPIFLPRKQFCRGFKSDNISLYTPLELCSGMNQDTKPSFKQVIQELMLKPFKATSDIDGKWKLKSPYILETMVGSQTRRYYRITPTKLYLG